MRTFKNIAGQGDLLLLRIDAIPKGMVPSKVVEGRYIVAHSETGHHHSVDAGACAVYDDPNDPLVSYMEATAAVEVVHEKTFDVHEDLQVVEPGTFILRRQREYTPEGFQRVAD